MNKWKSKIRKLLALAQSDNPYEAERAKVQAHKLMSKHGLSEADVEVVVVATSVIFPRLNPKQSETLLMSALDHISGCITYTTTSRAYTKSFRRSSKTAVMVMGPARDAEIAAYCWDVLYSQLVEAQKQLKKQYSVNAAEVERYSGSWVAAASMKLVNAFGHKAVADTTEKQFQVASEHFGKGKTLAAAKIHDPEVESALLTMGRDDGAEASLHVAAENARRHEQKLATTPNAA